MIETEDRWLLPLSERTVERLCIDFGVTLMFGDALELHIEQPFVIEEADGSEALVVPEGDPQRLVAVIGLVHRVVAEATGFKDGHLEIVFADGSRIGVPPNEGFEAWELVGPGGLRTVSLPGGELAVWRSEDDPGAGTPISS